MSQQLDVGSQSHQPTSSSSSSSFRVPHVQSVSLNSSNYTNTNIKTTTTTTTDRLSHYRRPQSLKSSVTSKTSCSSSIASSSSRSSSSDTVDGSSRNSNNSISQEQNSQSSTRSNQNTPEPESTSWTTDDEEEEEVEGSDLLITDADDINRSSSPDSETHRRRPQPPSPPPLKQLSRRDRVKFLVERALVDRIQENRLPHPRRPWFIRQMDILFLRLFVFMMRYHRELCIIFLLFASGMASFRTGPMKTRSTPAPKPFFVDDYSLKFVKDFYRGDYVNLVQNQISLGPAFVFYYAPWDSESAAARGVFTRVAQYFSRAMPGQIRFFAVNCWWPEGECRKNYKNLSHFPIFVAHLEKHAGIIYSGPIRAELMIKFVNSLLRPITRIDTEEEVWRFRAQHDAIMLGYFNFTEADANQHYDTYLQMALRNFEADPFGQVGFGLFLRPELAEKFFLTSSNVISLVLFNEIHTAKWSGDRKNLGVSGPVSQVANWVIGRTKKTPITWAYQIRTGFANRPVALGPIDLVDELSKGPVMLLITRRYFPSSYSPFYAQVKEVALDYFNCNKSGNVTKLRRTIHKLNSEWITLWNSVAKVCSSQNAQLKISEECAILKDQLKHWNGRKGTLQRESLASYENVADRMNFTGFSCASERPFKFFAIDPVDMPYFVELGLGGLGYTKDNSDPLLFVIDAPNDIVLPFASFNVSAIAELIYRYTIETENGEEGGLLSQGKFWTETIVHRPLTPFPQIESPQGYNSIKELVGTSDNVQTGEKKHTEKQNAVKTNLVKSITSEDLLKYLKGDEPFHESNPLFVMFTAKFCGLCGVGLTHFVELSRFLSDYYDLGVNITFAKLDMFKNSLPQELMPDHLPTFVYFPPVNRTDSRVFPEGEVVNTKTLLRFLLGELDSETRVKLSLLSPGCTVGDEECTQAARKRLESKCSTTLLNSREANSSNSSSASGSPRNNCLSANKAVVTDQIQQILEGIQNTFQSNVQKNLEDNPFRSLMVFNLEKVKTQDLEHLRSMKLTLDVS